MQMRKEPSEEFAAALFEIFAAHGKAALRRALWDQPIPFVKLMVSLLPAAPTRPAPAPHKLSREEIERRVQPFLRALGKERIAELIDEEKKE